MTCLLYCTTLKGKITALKGKWFLFRVDPFQKANKNIFIRVPSPENVSSRKSPTVITTLLVALWLRAYVNCIYTDQGPIVQSVVSLTSLLVVKMLTVLRSSVSNSQVFFWKNVSSFCKCKSYSHFFSKNISIYAIFNDQRLNNMLSNGIISFEQLGPDWMNKVLS